MKAFRKTLCFSLAALLAAGIFACVAAADEASSDVGSVSVPLPPEVSAQSQLVMHLGSGEILLSKNAESPVSVAFLPKVMTVLLAFEKIQDLNETVTVSDTAFSGNTSRGSDRLKVGESLKAIDLIYCVMLATSNEACNVLAEHIAGSVEAFVAMMNLRASELGAVNTLFTTANGIINDGEDYTSSSVQHTTAADAAKITAFAVSLERLPDMSEGASANQETVSYKAVSDKIYYIIEQTNKQQKRELYSSNRFLLTTMDEYDASVTGIKTGITSFGYSICAIQSGTFAGLGKEDLLCVTMFSESVDKLYSDTSAAWKYCFDNCRYAELVSEGQIAKTVDVKLGSTADKLNLVAVKSVSGFIMGEYSRDKLVYLGELPESVTAPIVKGETVCSFEVIYDNKSFGTAEFAAAVTVTRDELGYMISQISDFFSSIYVRIVSVLIILAILFYIGYAVFYNKKRKRARASKVRNRFRF